MSGCREAAREMSALVARQWISYTHKIKVEAAASHFSARGASERGGPMFSVLFGVCDAAIAGGALARFLFEKLAPRAQQRVLGLRVGVQLGEGAQ